MERKRLFVVGVDGSPAKEDVPKEIAWASSGPEGGAFVFGCSQRSEDDAERALRFSLTLTDSPHRATVKYVNVDIDSGVPALDWEKEIRPDLERLEPGEVSVSPDLAKIYARLFVFEPVEDEKELFLIRGDRRRPARTRGLKARYGKMIGRERELARLVELVQQIQEDQGQVVALIGAAGIGKTRLKMALREGIQKQGVECCEGVHHLRSTETYQGFRQVVRALVEARSSRLDALGISIAEMDYLELLTKPERLPENLKGLSDEDLKKGLFFAVRKLLHKVAVNPLVLIFEDLHWADAVTMELLEYVMEEMEKTKLLLLLIHRPEVTSPWMKRLNYTGIDLRPFAQAELEAFVKDVSSVDRIPVAVVSMLGSVSLGNPLFIEEMLRNLLEAKALEIQTLDNEEKLLAEKGLKAADIPSTIHSLIASRFDRLPIGSKEALRWAAALGFSFEREEYLGLLQQEVGGSTEEDLKRLLDHRYLFEKSVFPVHQYQFSHDVIHAVVLENIAGRKAQIIHRKIGEYLTKRAAMPFDVLARIAEHHLHGDDSKKAVETAVKAGEAAIALFRLSEAEHFLSAALARWKELKGREIPPHAIYRPLIQVLLEVADLDTTERTLDAWKKCGVDHDLNVKADYWTLQMRLKQAQEEHQGVIDASDAALEAFEHLRGRREEKFRVIEGRIDSLYNVGRPKEATEEGLRAIEALGEESAEIRIGIWGRLARLAARSGLMETALNYLHRARSLTLPSMPPVVRFNSARQAAFTVSYFEMRSEERREYDRAVEIAREAGMRNLYVQVLSYRGSAANEWGDFNLLFRDLEEAYKEARQMRSLGVAEFALFCIVDALFDLGAIDEACAKWETLTKEFPKPRGLRQQARRLSLENTRCSHQGDFAGAAECHRQSAQIFGELGDAAYVGRARFQLTKAEVKGSLRPISDIVADFNRAAADVEKIQTPITHYARREAAYWIAAAGGQPHPAPEAEYDTLACPNSYYRQYLSVAKIRWLDAAGKKKEAAILRELYGAERKRMLANIPTRYHASFEAHPFYRVPDTSGK